MSTEDERERAALLALLRQAHDAMLAWHLAHGAPDALATPEEAAMGAACRAIWEELDGDGR